MKYPRRLLLLEDAPDDAELLRRHISAEWPACEVVTARARADFEQALRRGPFDLILSDYVLPAFGGLAALGLARQICAEVPFLFVSGAIGDEVAVESLKAGATDYVLKDRLVRLVPAIQRALKEAEEHALRTKMSEQLRLSEEQYRDLFENATDLIQSVSPEGIFRYVNRAWRETLGYSDASLPKLNFFEVLHPGCHAEYRERLRTATGAGASSWEAVFLTRSGRELYVEGNLGAHVDSGELVALRGILHNVTEKKLALLALNKSIQQYEELVNSVDGIVWQADFPSLRFSFVSRQAERLLGYPASCWLETPDFWQQHIHPEDREKALAHCRSLGPDQKHLNFEYRVTAADGRIVWLRDIVSFRDEPGEPARIQGIMVDISPRKQAEAGRRESEVKLEQSNRDLVRKNQEIQNFYHTLSHELKTPLTSAREFIAIVMDGLAGPLNDGQMEYLSIARESCNQLRVCINDLLDATRLETGKLAIELKPRPLAAIIQRVVATMMPGATEKKLTLKSDVQPELGEVPLDESRIKQVITNLVNNAIKNTPAGGQILVSASEAPGQPELVQVSVMDTGCGIAKEEHERIFDRLYQIKAGDATTEQGVGLGLYLCRELIQLHGGNIWVESEPGRGSTFSFVLPRDQHWLQTNLLLIDDDPDVLDMLSHLLSAEHYNVRTARDGAGGLEEMRRQVPDIVLIDLAMPNLDGASTLKEIRNHWGAVPVIVHTGFSNSELMKQALAYSPFTLLAKPSTANQVIETVRKVQRSGDTAIWRRNHFGLQRPRLQ
ncbi:MAG TPA: response regulator [Methylomirabilota bacterium]|nr:response regulator [Methylomirabilota bacterium]